MRPFDGRRVLLVVSGGIAAYKSAILTRRLIEAGAGVEVILTASAERFIGRVTFEGITGRPVHASLWDRPMAHLDLGLEADVVVVAPATANLISRLAVGAADDLATTAVLASRAPVIICPAMNTRMWEHPITQANVARLIDVGYGIAGPADGPLAEGESGPGRLLEPEEILPRIGRALETATGLRGRKVVATAGPTRTALDPVRFISNRSSGRMGFALAEAAWRRGGEVTLISGPSRVPRPAGPDVVEVETAGEMLAALETALTDADILLMAAAVGDFEPARAADSKIKKTSGAGKGFELALRAGPDLLLETRAFRERKGIFTLGFALETEDLLTRGREKLERKGMHLVAVNSAVEPGAGFESETNRITLIDRSGRVEELPLAKKTELADELLDRIEASIPAAAGR
ncbi:bifunctional phosphopantothenoylcysteine decarboxylase/phosphopantothenate--cysteine ligase CoaBC [Candidatus Palauibacter soopunensis]|uniref:bifunctional phosphopantothenoylcysteine decarboxylase/phosphopantothenate--cysteine ligase CoaBC n=1 Tax=Candidatus Palauibacter soopunensis TaxID=3056739 RepID=UPI002383D9F1|nr:bifunctional phosphopantothenoylcysteine decarboxylase/phosphopantothenate--cysteine ligase CoaBC [Candidatus Palauibacter soopunensis]MDE2880066.1 bifunctional phosphopantothenoylcysteine decarboxylase/phosphopantothenate--cysteine ligase CoaBC [Candidatus Palauibacter soopunensis]